jgi:MFS family permease
MNVMITDISRDLNTDVKGVQTTITLFLLIMAVLMIPCSKLTDRWGRERHYSAIGTGVIFTAATLGVLVSSPFGTAIAGTILVSDLASGNGTYVAAMIVLAAVALAGLRVSILLPSNPRRAADTEPAPSAMATQALEGAVY